MGSIPTARDEAPPAQPAMSADPMSSVAAEEPAQYAPPSVASEGRRWMVEERKDDAGEGARASTC